MDIKLQFLLDKPDTGTFLFGQYEPWLVILSILVAVFTSSVALETATQIKHAGSKQMQSLLLLVGSFAMGGGVWAMHFIGMLAFQICGNTGYNVPITLLSMIPSVLASALALVMLSADSLSFKRMLGGGTLIGAGIGTMHYSGMAAMEISSSLYYDPVIFGLSIIVVIALSVLGVWVRFGLKHYFPNLSHSKIALAGGFVLGLAVSGMHYTGMKAAVFIGDAAECETYSVEYWTFLAVAIATVTIFIAFTTLGLNLFVRHRNFNQNLQREQNRQAAIYNTAVDGIIQIDHRGNMLEYNPACEKMFGYKREEVLGKNVKMLMPENHSRNHDGYLNHYQKTGEKKIIGIGREVMGLRKDGSQFPLELSVGEAADPSGSMYIGILRDITERKQMEEQLLSAINEAQQAVESKTAFLTNMSHEIRTPMNAIIGFVEVVLSKKLDDEQRRQLDIVHHSARSLLRLLNDILDTAKLDQHAVELELQPFDLPLFLDEMLSVFNNNARNKGLNWHVEWDEDMPPCYLGDLTRIRQILINLIGNAIKFTEKGQVKLTAKRVDDHVIFEVSDTGIGIPQDKIEEIFTPFAQTDASITRRFGGTGLGTSIARQLTELMGGKIEVESVENLGSLFRVKLPLEISECPVSFTYTGDDSTRYQITPRKILIAEDVSANAELLTLRLKENGHSVVWVQNGQLAFDAVQNGHFDLVLMDVQMPGTDGLTATRLIRKWEQKNNAGHLPIIALTAGAFQEDRKAADDAGMDGFVTKPIQFDMLFAEIARVLNEEVTSIPAATPVEDLLSGLQNLSDINVTEGLARWGNAKAYRDNLLSFAQQFRDFDQQIAEALCAGQTENAQHLAHRLKGAAGNLAITNLTQCAMEIEASLHQGETDLDDLLKALTTGLITALADIGLLNEHLETQKPICQASPQSERLASDTLAHLIKALQDNLLQGSFEEGLLKQLREGIGSDAKEKPFIDLEEAINNFDFDPAIEHLMALAQSVCPQEFEEGVFNHDA
ncbi:MHYT domain-containing protein [Terasakiella pusilla]|uniref:MHYT domain-containing protein n=1 Tax=Terasakiella pusilla TaxID=64973 RepID=UPI003AA826AA